MRNFKFKDLLKQSGFNLINKHTTADGVVDNVFLTDIIFNMFIEKYPCLLPSQDDMYSDALTPICTDDTLLDMDDSVWQIFDNAPAYCVEDVFNRIKSIISTAKQTSSLVCLPLINMSFPTQRYDLMLNLGNAYLNEQWQLVAKQYGYKVREARERNLVANTEYKYYAVLANILMSYDAVNMYLKPLLGMPLVTIYADETSPFFTFRICSKAYAKLQTAIKSGELQKYVLSLSNCIAYNVFVTNITACNKMILDVISSIQSAYECDAEVRTTAVHLYILSVLQGLSSQSIGKRLILTLSGERNDSKED